MKCPVGITLPIKDQKISDFLSESCLVPSAGELYPTIVTGPREQLYRRMLTNYEKKVLYSEPTMPWKRI